MLLEAHLLATSSFDIKSSSDVLSCQSVRVVFNREVIAHDAPTLQFPRWRPWWWRLFVYHSVPVRRLLATVYGRFLPFVKGRNGSIAASQAQNHQLYRWWIGAIEYKPLANKASNQGQKPFCTISVPLEVVSSTFMRSFNGFRYPAPSKLPVRNTPNTHL